MRHRLEQSPPPESCHSCDTSHFHCFLTFQSIFTCATYIYIHQMFTECLLCTTPISQGKQLGYSSNKYKRKKFVLMNLRRAEVISNPSHYDASGRLDQEL